MHSENPVSISMVVAPLYLFTEFEILLNGSITDYESISYEGYSAISLEFAPCLRNKYADKLVLKYRYFSQVDFIAKGICSCHLKGWN